MNAHTDTRIPALVGGGNVMAIVPSTFEETWRIAKAVLVSGLAPAALVGRKEGDDAVSAVAVAIMSGAELGLKPMVSLRSFTVINGKPALYGDGLINVVRMSGRVAYLRTGCEMRDGKMIGFCEAKRSDTGEDKRVEFSQDDAIRAGLWQTEAVVTKWNKWDKKDEQKPNDSPWYRFPQRMLAWRAAGYCLRELFGDVLGGIRDEFEVREIEGEFIEHDEPAARIAAPTPPSPPKPPSPSAAKAAPPSPPTVKTAVDPIPAKGFDNDLEADGGTFDLSAFLAEINEAMATGKTEEEIIDIWDGFDVEATLTDDEDALQRAFDMRKSHLDRAFAANHPVNAG